MNRKNIRRLLTASLLTVVALFVFTGPSSAQSETAISVSPSGQAVVPGGSFNVDIYVDPASAIAGVQVDLSFNPALVQAYSVTEGDLLNQGGCSTFFMPGTIDNEAGTISGTACAITQQGCTVSEAGTFITVHFTAGTAEGTSALNLYNVIAGDIKGAEVPVLVNDGNVIIGSAAGPTSTATQGTTPQPTPTATATAPATSGSGTPTPTSTPSVSPAPDTTAQPTSTAQQTSSPLPSPTQTQPTDEGGANWPLVGGILGGAVLLVVIVIGVQGRGRRGKGNRPN